MQQQALHLNAYMINPQYMHTNSLSALSVTNNQVPDIDEKLSKLDIMSAAVTPQPISNPQQAPPKYFQHL